MICVAPVLIEGVTYLTVEPQTTGCTLGVLLTETDASWINQLFITPDSAILSNAFWTGFQIVAMAYLCGWSFGVLLNFIKER